MRDISRSISAMACSSTSATLAHEDDAQRAVRAGLGMVEALGQLNTRLGRGARCAPGHASGDPPGWWWWVTWEVAPGGNSWRWARRPSSRLVYRG